MTSKKMNDIINKISGLGKMAFQEAATEEQILQFEEKHGVILSKQYKEWLHHSDGGDCFLPAGVQFYGVSHHPLIDEKSNDRPDESYIVIGALCTGDPVLSKKQSEQIAIYNQESNRIEEDEVYDDLFAFLIDLPKLLGIEE